MIWPKHNIRCARKMPLLPVLIKMGYSLRKLEHGNYLVETEKLGSVVVKDSYWFLKDSAKSRDSCTAGNAIDFFVIVEKMPFAQAMAILAGNKSNNTNNNRSFSSQRDSTINIA